MSMEDTLRDAGRWQSQGVLQVADEERKRRNEHVEPVVGSLLNRFFSAAATGSVNCDPRPVSLIAEEMDEQRRRRRERLRREAMQQAARELEEALGLDDLAIDAGCLSAVFETLNAKLEGLR
jgi:hypothetical protein